MAVPEGSGALLVSHGGCIEPALVACLPQADHPSWGLSSGHCDGARLIFDNGHFVDARLHRAPDPSRLG
ncbi:hypothetical protein FXF50_21565 [Micromonospora sp. AP08]|uniref:hypothetical protein n=1 Tax=Micromonospora sp. AP08 TaxID=2604467 RepID=UPI0011D9F52F|nr:hypothetical protein [Micromonospora sp. AP08]TYB35919.1 hypothetical protein FXF50_21565 [Micromonospora sp. AP08]